MSATDIALWFAGARDFPAGVLLWRQLGIDDPALDFLFDQGATSVSRTHLEGALRSALDQSIAEENSRVTKHRDVVTKADIVQERHHLGRHPKTDGYDQLALPPELQQLRQRQKERLQEMSFLRNRLELLPTDADRYRDALRIVELDRAIASAYSRLDAWKTTGRDPGDANAATSAKGAGDLAKELRNIITYISRVNSGQRKASPEQLDVWRRRKDELEKTLNAL